MRLRSSCVAAVGLLLFAVIVAFGNERTRQGSLNREVWPKGEMAGWLPSHVVEATATTESEPPAASAAENRAASLNANRYESGAVRLKAHGSEMASLSAGAEMSQVDMTYLDVFGLLSAETPCSAFFGGVQNVLKVFDQFANHIKMEEFGNGKIGIRMQNYYLNARDAQTGAAYRLFKEVRLNRRGAFFRKRDEATNKILNVGSFEGTTREARALMLLHELGHLIKGSDGNWLLPDDGSDLPLSARNTTLVEEKCGEQIKDLRKKETEGAAAPVVASGNADASGSVKNN